VVQAEEAPPRASEPLVVMAKPVGPICNLECSYCYYLDTARMYERPHLFRMTDDLLETYVREYIAASPGPIVHFVWHGGEPALAGLDFYRRAVELQQRYLPEGWTCWNNLQTNGTLLDEEWCAFIADAHFDVGLSIDGTPSLHDRFRKDHQGGGSYHRALDAIRRLQAHGVQPDILCTVNADLAREPLSVYRALRDLNTGWMQFIPIVRRAPDGGVTPDSVSPEAYGRFLSIVFNEWIHHDLGAVGVQLFAELSSVWSGGEATLCWMAPTCGRVVVLEHDGSVYACDHFVGPDARRGNIATEHLATLVDSEVQRRFGDAKRDRLPDRCGSCPWLSACNGGCPKDRFVATDAGADGYYLCDGMRAFFAFAEPPLRSALADLRRGMPPQDVMNRRRAETMERWRGVGRNDSCPCGSGLKAKQCCWWQRQ